MVISDERPPVSPSSFPYAFGLLHEFPPAVATLLLRQAKPVLLRRGDVLFRRGDPGDACFLVHHGLIKSSIMSDRGEESIVSLHGAGAIIGEIAMIDGLPRMVTTQALNECRLDAIGRDAFRACMRDHPEMSAALIAILAGRLRRAGEDAAWANLLPARARVARAMLRIARRGEPRPWVQPADHRCSDNARRHRCDGWGIAGGGEQGPQRLAKGGNAHRQTGPSVGSGCCRPAGRGGG